MLAGGNDVHAIDQDGLAMFRGLHRHGRNALQDFAQRAFVLGRQVEHDDECHSRIGRHRPEKLPQRRDATRRPAQPHHDRLRVASRRNDVVQLVSELFLADVRVEHVSARAVVCHVGKLVQRM
jgi:hypothetical protein